MKRTFSPLCLLVATVALPTGASALALHPSPTAPMQANKDPRPGTMTIDGITLGPGPMGAVLPFTTYKFGVTNTGSSAFGGGAGAGKATFSDITLTRVADEASPDFLVNCATGMRLKGAVLKVGGFTITLADVMITGYHLSTEASATPLETVTLNFTRYEISSPGGKKSGFDLKRGTKI